MLDWFNEDSEVTLTLDEPQDKPQLSKQDRRKLRLKRCGQPISRFDRKTGLLTPTHYLCDIWQECAWCFSLRVARLERRLDRIFQCDDVQEVILDPTPHALKYFRRDHPAKTYVCYPVTINSETRLVIYLVSDEEVGPTVEEPSYSAEVLARTPQGYKMSGKLGLTTPTPQEGEKVLIHEFTCNADEQTMLEAWHDAYLETSALNPTTADQFKSALLTRQEALQSQLIKRGVDDFSFLPHTYIIQEKDLDWTFRPDHIILLRYKIDQFKVRALKKAA